ncbi:Crp/Fnr family transcriptional regulator [Cellulomonas sp. KRMCY2]|uniref:Crp/Fnr family transcriptional regulator n=1 Tax=Cellulomonas sp. KRMCY2 TaxID=1304865 RepID=UPI001E53D269|nr:Crp/Fnr family transcriptional regulator [Cellulomonas sp. KRMCY2]
MSDDPQATGSIARGAGSAPTGSSRRRVPLRTTCAQPHHCPKPVRMDVLRHVPYFSGLTDEELDAIDRRLVSLSWAQGDPLYHAGDAAQHLYVLAAGRVKLSQPTTSGNAVVTDVITPGRLFGAMSTLGEPVHGETAQALVTSCALRIDQDSFRAVLTEHPQVALRVLDDIADRLARSHTDAGQRATGTVAQRVATALLRLADQVGQERATGGTLLQIPLSRADLAGLSGSTAESVSRVMSSLRKDGVIDSGRRWTAVLDRDRLQAVADGH